MTPPLSMTHEPCLRVLVVDDSVDNAEMLAELIGTLGHRVRVAHLAAAAIALLEEAPADLVLLDLGLPDADGLTVARSARARFGAAIRIIAVTGFGRSEKLAQAQEAGCDDLFVKPLKLDQLRKLLEHRGIEASRAVLRDE
jgi:CheY-like chemotaxis protein